MRRPVICIIVLSALAATPSLDCGPVISRPMKATKPVTLPPPGAELNRKLLDATLTGTRRR